MKLRLVLISDTHGLHRQIRVPDGDILVHAGDLTGHGRLEQLVDLNDWLGELPHRHKIIIAGNHDFCFERTRREAEARITKAVYLQDAAVTVEGVKIYGSAWQPRFMFWAFNLDRGAPLRTKWKRIPRDVDILVTHGPPLGHGDLNFDQRSVGCEELLARLQKVQPRVHLFGHIHEGYGTTEDGATRMINASICDLRYRPVNAPVVLDLEVR